MENDKPEFMGEKIKMFRKKKKKKNDAFANNLVLSIGEGFLKLLCPCR